MKDRLFIFKKMLMNKHLLFILLSAYCLEADKSSAAFLNFEPAGDMPCPQVLLWEEVKDKIK